MMKRTCWILVAAELFVLGPLQLRAQTAATGLEVGGVPAINFDADEGF